MPAGANRKQGIAMSFPALGASPGTGNVDHGSAFSAGTLGMRRRARPVR